MWKVRQVQQSLDSINEIFLYITTYANHLYVHTSYR